jgi:hypothetical protein
MRTYGRISGAVWNSIGAGLVNSSGGAVTRSGPPPGEQFLKGTRKTVWVEVQTDVNGDNSWVYLVTMLQELQLELNESPFFANRGLPARESILQQVAPDLYMSLIQQNYSQYFASLVISRQPDPASGDPTYQVNVIFNSGVIINTAVPVPE